MHPGQQFYQGPYPTGQYGMPQQTYPGQVQIPPQFYPQQPAYPQQLYWQQPHSSQSYPQGYEQQERHGSYRNIFAPRPKQTADSFSSAGFDDVEIRNAFIRKVYLILFAQLTITAGVVALFMFIPEISIFVRRNPILFHASLGLFFITYFVLACCPRVRRTFPGNYIALALLTLVMAYFAGVISCNYGTLSVLSAVGVTAVTCLIVTVFAMTTCIDFTKCYLVIAVLSVVLILFGIACLVVYYVLGYSRLLHTIYGGVTACLFVLYIILDTQMLIGGRSAEISPEEYIFAAVQLYVDIINLFLIILSLTGSRD
ncbi:hypothetical protein CRM22_005169 [Opisthorchis felineus]|uniref:Uncharacterized protein n=1 Tax=Opisthorchis felineus TaxID=147828 RepID=A0A4S2LSF7_OPIFE|nr:hypothetical protein CRM22_005169 [Opisthorchis felineus]